jgi:murein hydrolase activator
LQAQWRGEVFQVGDDAAVRAVHAGQAVYADWMRGYGFLVILDHGEGYLTLYGNNRELLASQGQQVAAGDVIAHAGATSTVIAPGLYFELRHEGQTLNPRPWWHSK